MGDEGQTRARTKFLPEVKARSTEEILDRLKRDIEQSAQVIERAGDARQ